MKKNTMIGLNEIRECCSCDRPIGFIGYIHRGTDSGIIDKLGILLYKEIWKNEIFILRCCICFDIDKLYGSIKI